MKHAFQLFATFFIIVFLTFLSIQDPQVIGAVSQDMSPTLDKSVNSYFNTLALHFPSGSCGIAAHQLYLRVAQIPTATAAQDDLLSTFTFSSSELNLTAHSILAHYASDTLLKITTHESSPFTLTLSGTTNVFFTITSGSFSTPHQQCTFAAPRNVAICDCKSL